MDVAGKFGKNLARCRERANLSQEELAARASLGRSQIAILEGGKRLPRIDTLVKLAGALSIAPDELLEGIVWRPGAAVTGNFELTAQDDNEGSA
jgi:transcriptional regulator with XRE-family HTH domain